MQSSILTFLSAESDLFRSNDLELLARTLLASSDLDFWVAQAAAELLSTVSGVCNDSPDMPWAKNHMDYYTVPDWLEMHKKQNSSLPSLFPQVDLLQTGDNCKRKRVAESETNCRSVAPDGDCSKVATSVIFGQDLDCDKTSQENSTTSSGVLPSYSVGTQVKSCDPLPVELLQPKASDAHVSLEIVQTQKADLNCEEEIAKAVLGPDLYMRAKTLRERLLEMQQCADTVDDINVIRTSIETTSFLNVIKPWELADEITLFLTENLLGKEESFLWSTKIMSYILLPKVLSLQEPASRILMTAVFHACKAHRRAAVDALLVPLTLCMQGPNTAQCEVINRVVKECLPPEHTLSFSEKVFLQTRRQKLHFALPPPDDRDYIMRNLVWSEPVCVLVQNLLHQKLLLDQETLGEVVAALEKVAAEFVTSLKFSNLLLCLITKHGPRLMQHRNLLQRVLEKTKTFMTKSALAKLAAL